MNWYTINEWYRVDTFAVNLEQAQWSVQYIELLYIKSPNIC